MAILVAAILGAAAAEPRPHGFIPPASAKLIDEILAKDRELFDAVFETCSPDKVAALVTDDFEFYHDKEGQTARSGKQFADDIAGMCERQRAGTDYRARRELDRKTVRVYPLRNYGAVEIGVHRFYSKEPGKKSRLLETARFTNLWKNDQAGWRLSRVLSYDHRAAQ